MFSWFRRKIVSKSAHIPPAAHNPGIGTTAKIAFANGERTWTEEIDAVDAATQALTNCGHVVEKHDTWVEHRDSGFAFHPQLAELQPLGNGGVRTVTTIEIRHPRLVPDGIFEFQHATGDSSQISVIAGIEQWAKVDFVPLLDALRDTPGECMAMQMTFSSKGPAPELPRRAVLGPVVHYAQHPVPTPAAEADGNEAEHPFCACCLLTNTFQAFQSMLEADLFCGIRLYAARDENGRAQADCRVNGGDWEPGKQALREYVATWPNRGFEFRKQYVVLQTLKG